VFDALSRTEWDTLLFFYGAIACVGGLGVAGYLHALTNRWYGSFGPDVANVALGVASAAIDNIPMTYAVLSADPEMSASQWSLLTLCAGCGGSMLSVGSAAGVGLMGVVPGAYTFRAHLRWTPAVAAGFFASVLVHALVVGVG
jgi:Na+/H+ antiporter NhaD/arsenite permease-like protein